MNNYTNDNTTRRYKAHVSTVGTTQLHLRSPYIIAWWSAAFPGFGHLLLSKYLRGYSLVIWEVLVNNMSHLNQAIIYSFTGEFDMAKEILEPRWLLLYLPVYIFGIWDSYRTTVDMNKVFILAERENANFNSYVIGALEINYLDKRRPVMAIIWSFFTPGLGQLYIHRVVTAIFIMILMIVFVYFSNVLIAVHYLFLGKLAKRQQLLTHSGFCICLHK